jgi:NADH dehydrogenase
VTLVNDVNFMLYTPLLPGAAGGTLEPRHVVVPLREELRRTELHIGTVLGADPERRAVRVRSLGGRENELRYDQLIVSLGSTSRTLPIPGLAEHALGFKTLAEAIALRNRLVQTLEQAEIEHDDATRRALLTYVFVGAGYAGLEGLAELQDFAADVVGRYPRSQLHGVRFLLVEAKDRVMTEIQPDLAAFASAELRRRGIEIHTGTTIERVSADSVELSTGEVVPTRTVAWTAGVKPHPVVAELGLPLDGGGRIAADRFCAVPGRPGVWAIGDAAAVPDPARKGNPSPPTAQHVLRQAKVAADNAANALAGQPQRRRPFRYRTLGVFVDMGRHQAVASTLGIKWRGFPAWFLARTYHLALMPGTARRARLMTDWTTGLLFGRDSAELGQLGHPPELDAKSSGGTNASGAGGDEVASGTGVRLDG